MDEPRHTPASISHYRILERIGVGGMGEVYLAEDARLGRKIAIKLLLRQFVDDEDRLRRFEQEARAASALNHPNIITIHEVGADTGIRFIAMEYIQGETLRQRMKRGKLPEREALEIAIQVGNALAAAHQAGIIHRDIKPENVMLRPDGYVKVLDFGVVKLTEKFAEQITPEGDRANLATVSLVSTDANIVMGSPNYMSPEQARGLAVDGRTDIFSLGAMIYEMITGMMPFDGATVSDIIVSILERRPPTMGSVTPDVSPRLEQIVSKALSKDRLDRHQSVNELLQELRRLKRRLDFEAGFEDSFAGTDDTAPVRSEQDTRATMKEDFRKPDAPKPWSAEYIFKEIAQRHRGYLFAAVAVVVVIAAVILITNRAGGPHAIESIAVMPFVNTSGDQNAEYLSDGITESLINNLSRSPKLRVMSRDSTFRFKGRDVSPSRAGRELGAQAVLTGRVTQRDDSLQLSVALVDARYDSQIWGEQYSRSLSDLLTVQEEIARAVVDKLELRLSGRDQSRISRQGTANTDAYQSYLKGRYYWNKRTEDGLKKGIEFFNEAIDADPVYAAAYAGLADCYAMLTEYSVQPPKELYPSVKAAARKALEIDDSLAEAHTSLAAAYEYEWNWPDAEKEYRRAIELNPNYATAHQWYGVFLSSHSRTDEAIAQLRQALDLDPLSLIINTSMGRALYADRQYDAAIEHLRKTLDMEPNFAEAHFQLALAYEGKRLYRQATAEFERCVELFGDASMRAWVGREYALEGKRSEAARIIDEIKRLAGQKYVSPYPVATIYAALGDKSRTMELLERVYDEHSYYVVWLNVDPVFDGLRAEPEFVEFLKRIGLTR